MIVQIEQDKIPIQLGHHSYINSFIIILQYLLYSCRNCYLKKTHKDVSKPLKSHIHNDHLLKGIAKDELLKVAGHAVHTANYAATAIAKERAW